MAVATSGARFAAGFVDALVVQLPVTIVFFLFAAAGLPDAAEAPAPEMLLFGDEIEELHKAELLREAVLERVILATTAVTAVLWLVYLLVGHATHGQTVGKRLLQLRIRRRSRDAPPHPFSVLARALVGLVWLAIWAALVGFAGLSFAVSLWSSAPGGLAVLESIEELHSVPMAIAVGSAALAFGITELVLVRRQIFLADRLSGTIVIQEGYGGG